MFLRPSVTPLSRESLSRGLKKLVILFLGNMRFLICSKVRKMLCRCLISFTRSTRNRESFKTRCSSIATEAWRMSSDNWKRRIPIWVWPRSKSTPNRSSMDYPKCIRLGLLTEIWNQKIFCSKTGRSESAMSAPAKSWTKVMPTWILHMLWADIIELPN